MKYLLSAAIAFLTIACDGYQPPVSFYMYACDTSASTDCHKPASPDAPLQTMKSVDGDTLVLRGVLQGATMATSKYPSTFTEVTFDQYTANRIQLRMVLGNEKSNLDLFDRGCITIPPAGSAKTDEDVPQYQWSGVAVGQQVTVFARILDAQEYASCYWEDFEGPGTLKPYTFVAE